MKAFTIEYQRDGIMRAKFRVPAIESGIVGIYDNGKPYQPANQPTRELLPYNVQKAFDRNVLKWWQFGLSDMLKSDLWSITGKPLGTLYARYE